MAAVSLVLGLYMASRDDGISLLNTLVNFRAMSAFLVLHVSVVNHFVRSNGSKDYIKGDGHCRQGEGEVCGTAVEAAMETTVVVDVVKGAGLHWPRLQGDDFIASTGSVKPLEDAFRVSQHDLVGWTGQLLGLDDLDALQLVSQAGLAPTGNVVDTNYTMVAKLPAQYLGGASVYDGIHERLRALGREHLAGR